MEKMIIGLVLFIGIHCVPVAAPAWHARFAETHRAAWKALVLFVALAGLVGIVKGYAEARLDPTWLWVPPHWLRHVAALLILPVFVFFFAPYFPGRIASALKRPQLVAVKLWAFAHLLVNGTLADVILFGSLLAWAVVATVSYRWRPAPEYPVALRSRANDFIVLFLGLAIYVLFVRWLHLAWIGVAPFG